MELRRSSAPAAPPAADNVRYYSDEDGALRLLLADGTDEAVGGGGGGSMPSYATAVNGLVKDFPLPDGAPAALIDPRAQVWESGRTYSLGDIGIASSVSAQVHPTDNDGVRFETCYGIAGRTGSEEPAWPNDGGTTVIDNNLLWAPTGNYLGSWEADTPYSAGDHVSANGFLWEAQGNGTSDGSAPDWASAPDPQVLGPNNTVVDNDITWTNIGPAAVWTADTPFGFEVASDHTNYQQDYVIPTAPAGFVYGLIAVTDVFTEGGETEPDWSAETPGSGHYYTDGAILWEETTDHEECVLTGIVAPSGPAVCEVVNVADPDSSSATVTLEDETSGSFAPDAQSAEGNQFPQALTDVEIAPAGSARLAYTGDLWQPLS